MSVAPGDEWGKESVYFSQGPQGDIAWDSTWLSVAGFWLTLPTNIIVALLGAFIAPLFRFIAGLGMMSVRNGRPLCLAWVMWWYQPMVALMLLVRSGKSRFSLFSKSRAIMGGGDWWWHGEGAWNCPYASVRATMESNQKRSSAFGAVRAAVPEVFPAGNLLFLDGEEHAAVRGVLESKLTSEASWGPRLAELSDVLKPLAPQPCTLATLDKATTDKMVATSVWFLLFGVKITPAEAAIAANWGASGTAGYFVFPRFIHRVAFNILLGRIKTLRKQTIGIATAHGLESLFVELNSMLGQYKRPSALMLCDEFMYAVNFAGVGGTQHATWDVVEFLQRRTVDVPATSVKFPEGSMAELYKRAPEAFIKEAVRLDAPVTSATCVIQQEEAVEINVSCCGGPSAINLAPGMLHQYVLSIANRDPQKFDKPDEFNPSRENLDDMIGWNGALSNPYAYPRICPGQKMSVAIIRTIIGLLDDFGDDPGPHTA